MQKKQLKSKTAYQTKFNLMRLFITAFCAAILFTLSPAHAAFYSKSSISIIDTGRIPYAPIPGNIPRLFYLQRDPNANTVVYELNVRNGQPDEDAPVHPYWIRYTENGKRQELGYIQRKFAYGISSASTGAGRYDVRLAAYKKFPLTLMKGSDGKYHIFATILKRQAIINRIFVKIEGGTFWFPNVRYIEIIATDAQTGKEITERFKP